MWGKRGAPFPLLHSVVLQDSLLPFLSPTPSLQNDAGRFGALLPWLLAVLLLGAPWGMYSPPQVSPLLSMHPWAQLLHQ